MAKSPTDKQIVAPLFKKGSDGKTPIGKALANMHDGPKNIRTHVHADRPNSPDDIEEDKQPIDPKKLAVVLEKSREQIRILRQVEKADGDLKAAKQKLRTNQTDTLPKAMAEAGITEDSMPLGGGAVLYLETLVTANIPAANAPRAENAAERNKVGIAYMNKMAPDLVVNTATITFAKGQEKMLRKLLNNLAKYKPPIEVVVESAVHSGTLGKWVRDQDKASKAVDEEALNVHRIKTAVVVLPKKKKDKV